MPLFIYYMYATVVQWWRLSSLRNKLTGTLNSHNALLLCRGGSLSDSVRRPCLETLLFQNEGRIGCTVVPKQKVDLGSFLYFPNDVLRFPIFIEQSHVRLQMPRMYVWLQAHLDTYTKHQSSILQIENYGELVGWKVSDQLEIILKTDMVNLTKLVNSFRDHSIDINHELLLLRLETVDVEGNPVKIKYANKYPPEEQLKYSLAPVHWKRFVTQLKSLYQEIAASKAFCEHPVITIEDSPKAETATTKPAKKSSEPSPAPATKHKLEVSHNRPKAKCKASETERRRAEYKRSKQSTSKEGKEVEERPKVKAHPKPITKEVRHRNKEVVRSERRHHRSKEKEKHENEENDDGGPKVRKDDDSSKVRKDYLKPKTESSRTVSAAPVDKGLSDNAISRVPGASAAAAKPPNVLVYADSVVAKDNVKNVLHAILNNHRYTIYDFPVNSSCQIWSDSTVLVVICGNVPPSQTSQMLQYLLNGGRLFCLCSDLLNSILTVFSTAEVREHELVRFSYADWTNVKMMHHVFCYQASPAKRQFSKDSDHSNPRGSSPVAPRLPPTVEVQHNNKRYTVQVQVLGAEETWHTPSLLLASVRGTKGRAIFSQVHLEIDPTQYQNDESKYAALKDSNRNRLEIMKHILERELGMDCTGPVTDIEYTPAYFLGTHNGKQEFLSRNEHVRDGVLELDKITLKFCGRYVEPEAASASFMPVLIYACPTNFSTVQYFDTLSTRDIGRLVIYTDVIASTQLLLTKKLKHGITVIAREQTQGTGRAGNAWLSPAGCAMFSLQLHVPIKSPLGQFLPIIQHYVMLSVVSAIKRRPGYENIELGLKWPNDLYANGKIKIGGLVTTSTILNDFAITNIGCGVNLSNAEPTSCINKLIREYNESTQSELAEISYEHYFATIFNELERIYNLIQEKDGLGDFFDLYYKYWLHSGAHITVSSKKGTTSQATIIGIDDYGFLTVRLEDGTISSVEADGNSFDMLKGLIAPKVF